MKFELTSPDPIIDLSYISDYRIKSLFYEGINIETELYDIYFLIPDSENNSENSDEVVFMEQNCNGFENCETDCTYGQSLDTIKLNEQKKYEILTIDNSIESGFRYFIYSIKEKEILLKIFKKQLEGDLYRSSYLVNESPHEEM